jgi:2-polyprenyl-3-methyl-5-hydroxy-6-metoxy-1,4-benzoquinol methylase
MLERTLEPEVMDTEEDAREYEAIDNSAVNADFVDHVLRIAPADGEAIDIGAGPGHVAVSLAQRAPGLRVLAVDLAESMLERARAYVERSGVRERVLVARLDAKKTGLAAGSFDLVLSNSLVHHIPSPVSFFAEVARLASANAAILIKDLHRPASDVEHRELVARYASDCSPRQRELFSDSLRAALTVGEVADMCSLAGLHGVTVRRTSDRHWAVERGVAS